MQEWNVRFLAKWLHLLNAKMRFRPQARNCIFARRFRLLTNFYRLGTEIFQIVKKTSVFGHSVTE